MPQITTWDLLWWVILPYVAIAVFIVGHIWRWRYDQFGWTSRSTQLQERRLLKWGAPLFHYATFAAIAGHVMGILIPKSFTDWLGIHETWYQDFSAIGGSAAAIGVLIGGGVLLLRRTAVPRVRATTSAVDYLALILLGIIVLLGIYLTLGIQNTSHYEYRNTVGVWFRSLFAMHPNVHAIAAAPLMYQVHAVAAWAIFLVWPFSRLVHAWSYPLWYLWRPYIVVRSRIATQPKEPGTGGKWRKIGVPY
ncbi:respiratory nitrate reductase subunit gamma [Mycolicibacter sinensis]|uniref:respiratory nitrate reductase subunit gamma n=1 Tax=Mycolicibacter sinensis (strain JDM601) TaxID=875328 RepID=UPI001F357BCB|nr:respiratory nitrate reductase subunit gamma [Mycolicibacter sinensis]MDD7814460.1 respiratory nitrate reductase subunit gamma [Mycobacterium sp. CSUR Q5927]